MIKELLKKNKKQILEEWQNAAYETYPEETTKIFGKGKDRFQNPVGVAIADGLNQVYDFLIDDGDISECLPALDKMIRIRSIQDFSPSKAIGYIFCLREIIHKNLKSEITENNLIKDLLDFDKDIDRLALLTFDSYMDSREKINELKINQAKNGSLKIADRVNRRLNERAENNNNE